MSSHSDNIGRQWSVMPSRAIGDKKLKERELRVLGALCIYTNRVGVCWPSMAHLCEILGYAERKTIHEAMKRLKTYGYVRQLDPKDYQETATGWLSNRYQVLWKGDEPMPSNEEIHVGKPIGVNTDDESIPPIRSGGLGDDQKRVQEQAQALAHAYARGVQQATGQVRLPENEIRAAMTLVDVIHPPELVTLTFETCKEWLSRRAGIPALSDIGRQLV